MTKTTSETCSYFQGKNCLSCGLLGVSYEEGLTQKMKWLKEIFESHSSFNNTNLPLENIFPSPRRFSSRNKAKLVVSGTLEAPIIGLQTQELLCCPLHGEGINDLAQFLKEVIPLYKLYPYDLSTRRGELKYLLIQRSEFTGEGILRFVLRSLESKDRLKKLLPTLQAHFPWLKVVSINIQPIHQAIIEGEQEIILSEQKIMIDQLGPFKIAISPKSFYQTNSLVALELYQTAASLVKARKTNFILDLYCGVGAFSFFCAPWASEIFGVEISAEAILCARLSCQLNQLHHLNFFPMKSEEFLADLSPHHPLMGKFFRQSGGIIVNPPRGGLTSKSLEMILQLKPSFILYSSCNPQTLLRDLITFNQFYHIKSLHPFDMFPFTRHLEVLTLLEMK